MQKTLLDDDYIDDIVEIAIENDIIEITNELEQVDNKELKIEDDYVYMKNIHFAFFDFYKSINSFINDPKNQLKLKKLRQNQEMWQELLLRLLVLKTTFEENSHCYDYENFEFSFSYVFCSLILFLWDSNYELPEMIKDDVQFKIQIDKVISQLCFKKNGFNYGNVSLTGLLFYTVKRHHSNIDTYIELVLDFEISEYSLNIQDMINQFKKIKNLYNRDLNIKFSDDDTEQLIFFDDSRKFTNKSIAFVAPLPRPYQN